jgi:hypothetical protein
MRPDVPHQLKSVTSRHLYVGNHQIRLEHEIVAISVPPIPGGLDLVPLILEDLLKNKSNRRVIVDN